MTLPLSHPPDLSVDVLLDTIEHQRIGTEYQVLVDTVSLATVGHEALARFYRRDGTALPPQLVFDALHHSPFTLFQVELLAKRFQIAAAPPEGLLFLNVDPDAFMQPVSDERRHPMLALFESPQRLVVEIIENSSVQEAHLSQRLAEILKAHGVRLALDDIGSPESMLSLTLLGGVDYFKFDRSWLARRGDPAGMRLLKALLGYARELGKQCVLEGVETEQDLELARELEVDLVQGFLFRERFRLVRA